MSQSTARRAALHLLARRAYPETELRARLLQAGFAAEETETAIQFLIHEKLLDDQQYIENYIHYRRRRGFGPLRIQAELARKGLPENAIHALLCIHDSHWQTEARTVWEKRFRHGLPVDFREKARQMRFLQSRGFTQDQIEFIFRKSTDF